MPERKNITILLEACCVARENPKDRRLITAYPCLEAPTLQPVSFQLKIEAQFPVVTDQLICIVLRYTVAVMDGDLRYTVDEETIARLQSNDPTLTSLRLATFFVNSLPQHLYDAPKSFVCGGGTGILYLLLVFVLLLVSCSYVCL